MQNLNELSNEDLLRVTRDLSQRNNASEVELLLHLGEIDDRKLYLERACSSMFAFCRREYNFSEAVTHNRITVARKARELPQILDYLRSGKIHLSGLRVLVPVLKGDAVDKLLEQSISKSKREIEDLVAAHHPRPAVPDLIRKLPLHSPVVASHDPVVEAPRFDHKPNGVATMPAFALAPVAPRPAVVAALSAEQYKVQFTAERSLRNKISQAQELLRHQIPTGDLAEIFDRALTLLIAEAKKRRFASGVRKRKSKTNPAEGTLVTRHIPNAIKRQVYERDGGQCTFVDADGHRCESRAFIEFDHRDGFALHPSHERESIRLLCRPHNQHTADRLYGKDFMQQRRVPRGKSPGETEALGPKSRGSG